MLRQPKNTAEGFFGWDRADRAVSVGLVVLLHILVLAALLSAKQKLHEETSRETILRLLPFLRSAPPAEAPTAPSPSVAPIRKPVPVIVPDVVVPAPATPDATVLAPALNGCNLENLDNLPPEQRAKCIAYQNDVVGAARNAKDHAALNKPTQAKSAETWAQAIVKRNTPAKVDCARVETPEYGFQANMKTTRLMVDLTCAARHIADGKSPLN
jgi:hypothetical protein